MESLLSSLNSLLFYLACSLASFFFYLTGIVSSVIISISSRFFFLLAYASKMSSSSSFWFCYSSSSSLSELYYLDSSLLALSSSLAKPGVFLLEVISFLFLFPFYFFDFLRCLFYSYSSSLSFDSLIALSILASYWYLKLPLGCCIRESSLRLRELRSRYRWLIALPPLVTFRFLPPLRSESMSIEFLIAAMAPFLFIYSDVIDRSLS